MLVQMSVARQTPEHHKEADDRDGPGGGAQVFDAQEVDAQIDDAAQNPDRGAEAARLLGGKERHVHGGERNKFST